MIHIAADGARIHYETTGEAGPLLALVPGLGGDGRWWSGVVADLAVDHRLVVIDHRGAGRSDRPRQTYSIAGIAADVAEILATLPEPAHVVGHSTGGAVAQHIGLDHPHLARSLVLSSTWARGDARFRALFRARAAMLRAGQVAAYQRLTNVLAHTADYLAAHEDELEAGVAGVAEKLAPLEVTAARIEMLLDHDLLDDLPRIALPTLVIGAEADEITPFPMSETLATAIPGARLVRVAGAHFHPLADPVGFAGLLRGFLGEVTR